MVKAPTGEKISTSTTGNDKPQKRQYKSIRSVYSKKDCNCENEDDDEEDLKKSIPTKNVEGLE